MIRQKFCCFIYKLLSSFEIIRIGCNPFSSSSTILTRACFKPNLKYRNFLYLYFSQYKVRMLQISTSSNKNLEDREKEEENTQEKVEENQKLNDKFNEGNENINKMMSEETENLNDKLNEGNENINKMMSEENVETKNIQDNISNSNCEIKNGKSDLSEISHDSEKNNDEPKVADLKTSETDELPKFLKDKEKYLTMDVKEKRKFYKNKINKLDDVKKECFWTFYCKLKKIKSDLEILKIVKKDLNKKVALFKGDITSLEIDAIVNAANEGLYGGGGVDGAIHRAAGDSMLQAECRHLNGCHVGEAKITGGYKLPAKYIIHTVGPRGHGDTELSNCYRNSLDIAAEYNLRSIAFCCISTGIYGFPNKRAAKIAIETTRNWLEDNHEKMDLVIFCLFMKEDIKFYEKYMPVYFPIGDDYFCKPKIPSCTKDNVEIKQNNLDESNICENADDVSGPSKVNNETDEISKNENDNIKLTSNDSGNSDKVEFPESKAEITDGNKDTPL